jgi:hypothetical protein
MAAISVNGLFFCAVDRRKSILGSSINTAMEKMVAHHPLAD